MNVKHNVTHSIHGTRRYFLMAGGSAIASILFSSCSSNQSSNAQAPSASSPAASPATPPSSQTSAIKVGVWSVIADDILKFLQKDLAPSQGLDIQIVNFTDWVTVNNALKSDIDVNYFQHRLFMADAAKRQNLDLVFLNPSWITPHGLYSKRLKIQSVDQIPSGAVIGISSDISNQDRALKILKGNGLIKVKDVGTALLSVKKDVTDNPKNLQFKEIEGPALVRALDDLDLAIMSSAVLIQAKIDLPYIVREPINDDYAVGLVTLKGNETDPRIQKLGQLVTDPQVKDFINTTYKGAVVPAF
jgi:D-methionine transport system substrate-binding protein